MIEPYDDPIICEHCGDTLHDGDDYYDTPIGKFCPDCFDDLVLDWKRYVGDVFERC